MIEIKLNYQEIIDGDTPEYCSVWVNGKRKLFPQYEEIGTQHWIPPKSAKHLWGVLNKKWMCVFKSDHTAIWRYEK